jgi:hypothetical protein
MSEKSTNHKVHLLKVTRPDPHNRRSHKDRRKRADRRSRKDRRLGWGSIEDHLLEGAMTTAATLVFQFSRPFTILLGYVDLLAENAGDEQSKEKLRIIKDQLEQISRILNNFRELDSYQTKEVDGLKILDIDMKEPDGD